MRVGVVGVTWMKHPVGSEESRERHVEKLIGSRQVVFIPIAEALISKEEVESVPEMIDFRVRKNEFDKLSRE